MMTSQRPVNIKWPELVFYAEANHEPFQDITITTAQTSYVDTANHIASSMYYPDKYGDTNALDELVMQVINQQKHCVYETVTVDKDGIRVCINAAALDEEATSEALNRVAFALSELHGGHGTIFFSEALTFTTVDIPWLFD